MNLFPAKPFDIDSIMAIEHQSFIPQIQEKKKCFEKRLEVCPDFCFILSDSSQAVVKAHGSALTCGYFCSELWDSFPSESDSDEVFSRRFALGHDVKASHASGGMYLYVSSFALRTEYRGKGLGKKFFESSLCALCGANKDIKKVVIIVNEEWERALSIYRALGFVQVRKLQGFFPTIKKISLFKREMSAGIVMTADAEIFRTKDFLPSSENMWEGIKI